MLQGVKVFNPGSTRGGTSTLKGLSQRTQHPLIKVYSLIKGHWVLWDDTDNSLYSRCTKSPDPPSMRVLRPKERNCQSWGGFARVSWRYHKVVL